MALHPRWLGALLLASCQQRQVVQLPAFEGLRTLLVASAPDEVEAYELAERSTLRIDWEPSATELLLGGYRASTQTLFLDVDAFRKVALDPNGEALVGPSEAFAIDEDGEIRSVGPERWSAEFRVPGRRCAGYDYALLDAPFDELRHLLLAPDGSSILGVAVGASEARLVARIDRSGTGWLNLRYVGAFASASDDVWLVEAAQIIRVGADLTTAKETLDTRALVAPIERAVETDGSPRFYLLGADGVYYAWDGAGAPRALRVPPPDNPTRLPQLMARPGGALWIADGGLFGEYTEAGGFRRSELAPLATETWSRVVETEAHGALLVVSTRQTAGSFAATVLVRRGTDWVTLFPEGLIDFRTLVEHEGRLVGTNGDRVVDLLLGEDERPATACQVGVISPPPTTMIATREGIFGYGVRASGNRMGWLTPAL